MPIIEATGKISQIIRAAIQNKDQTRNNINRQKICQVWLAILSRKASQPRLPYIGLKKFRRRITKANIRQA